MIYISFTIGFLTGGTKIFLEWAHFLRRGGFDVKFVCDERPKWYKHFNFHVIPFDDLLADVTKDDVVVVCDPWQYRELKQYPHRKLIYVLQHYKDAPEKIWREANGTLVSVGKYMSDLVEKRTGDRPVTLLNGIRTRDFHEDARLRVKGRVLAMNHGAWKGILDPYQFANAGWDYQILSNASETQVSTHMQRADIFIHLIEEEGVGMPPIEAMASGCALVTTACHGVDEYAIDGVTCLKVPFNPQAIRDAVNGLLKDTALKERIRAAGIEKAQEYDWKNRTGALVDYFRKASRRPGLLTNFRELVGI